MNKIFPAIALVAAAGLSLTGCTRTVYVHTPATSAAAAPAAAEVPSDTPSAAFDYKDAGLTLTLKTTHKQCFGTAGCNVTVKPVLSVNDPSLIPDDATGTLTFSISGDDSGPVTDSITLTGSQYDVQDEDLSTTSSSVTPKITVTDISTDGQ